MVDRNEPLLASQTSEGAAPPKAAQYPRPSYLLLGAITLTSLALDLWTKDWALRTLEVPLNEGSTDIMVPKPIRVTSWLSMVLARNRGGAWGVLQTAEEGVRKPFFIIVSVAAIALIFFLYRRVHSRQHALKWGLPLVLGGAIGNLVDRVRHGWVVDFIDYKASWVRSLNELLAKIFDNHAITDHWPTFNVADIAICVGVGLMAIDIFTSRKLVAQVHEEQQQAKQQAAEHATRTAHGDSTPPRSSDAPLSAPASARDSSSGVQDTQAPGDDAAQDPARQSSPGDSRA